MYPSQEDEATQANLLAAQTSALLKSSANCLTGVLRIADSVVSKSSAVAQIVASFRGNSLTNTDVPIHVERRNAMLANASGTLRGFAREAMDASLEIRSVMGRDNETISSIVPTCRWNSQPMQAVHEELRLICERTRRSAQRSRPRSDKIVVLDRGIDAMLLEINKNELVVDAAAAAVEKYLAEIIKIVRMLEQIGTRS